MYCQVGSLHPPSLPRAAVRCVLRAWADNAEYPVLDVYPYASTSPIYVSIAGAKFSSPEDAKFFVAWIDKLIAAANSHTGYNTTAEKEEVLAELNRAREVYLTKEKP